MEIAIAVFVTLCFAAMVAGFIYLREKLRFANQIQEGIGSSLNILRMIAEEKMEKRKQNATK